MARFNVDNRGFATGNIVVKESNRDAINEMLNAVQKRCTVRCTDYDDIVYAIGRIERKLDIPKSAMIGIEARVDPHAETFCNAYKAKCFNPQSTHFTIKRTASGWTLTEAIRNHCMGSTEGYYLHLPEKAKEAIIRTRENF